MHQKLGNEIKNKNQVAKMRANKNTPIRKTAIVRTKRIPNVLKQRRGLSIIDRQAESRNHLARGPIASHDGVNLNAHTN